MARPSKYETHVKPRFDEIEDWIKRGASEKEVFSNLGVKRDAWIKYKRTYSELNDLIKKARKKPVEDIKAAMLKRALGFQYQEVEKTEEYGEITKVVTKVKTALPSETAGLILLQHWAKDEGWTRDPQSLELKKEELKIKKQQVEKEDW